MIAIRSAGSFKPARVCAPGSNTEDFPWRCPITVNTILQIVDVPYRIDGRNNAPVVGYPLSGWNCSGWLRLALHDLCVILVREKSYLASPHWWPRAIKVNRARNRFRRFFHRGDWARSNSLHSPLRPMRFFSICLRGEDLAKRSGRRPRMRA